jgi:hypothetical protein
MQHEKKPTPARGGVFLYAEVPLHKCCVNFDGNLSVTLGFEHSKEHAKSRLKGVF